MWHCVFKRILYGEICKSSTNVTTYFFQKQLLQMIKFVKILRTYHFIAERDAISIRIPKTLSFLRKPRIWYINNLTVAGRMDLSPVITNLYKLQFLTAAFLTVIDVFCCEYKIHLQSLSYVLCFTITVALLCTTVQTYKTKGKVSSQVVSLKGT